jgi:hypothetical protein
MKKALIYILAVFYLSISIGVTVDFHYCMDKISGWEFGHHEAKICSKCGMEESGGGGCCKDKFAVFKISIDQNRTSFSTLVPVTIKDYFIKPVILLVNSEKSLKGTNSLIIADQQPILSDRRLHLLHCVFLI